MEEEKSLNERESFREEVLEVSPVFSSKDFKLTRSQSSVLSNLTSNDYIESVAKCLDILEGGKGVLESIQTNQKRNKDFIECSIKLSGGSTLSFARVYGFRNIQNLVRVIKQNKATYQFIEIMACPSGCLGGGAQLKGQEPSFSEEDCRVIVKTSKSIEILNEISRKFDFLVEYKGLKSGESSNPLKIDW